MFATDEDPADRERDRARTRSTGRGGRGRASRIDPIIDVSDVDQLN
jgi:hypothetical protein